MLRQSNYLRRIVLLLLFVLVSPSIIAKEEKFCETFKNAKIDPSLIETMLAAAKRNDLYQIISSSSTMGFSVESSLGRVEGNFDTVQGGLTMQGSSSQTMVSVDVSSLKTNVLFIENVLKGDEFFGADQHPELIFASTNFEWISDNRAVLIGNLSIRGITKVVAFYVEFIDADGELSDTDIVFVKATTTIKRSEFGMNAMSSVVGDKVNLRMSIEAERFRVG